MAAASQPASSSRSADTPPPTYDDPSYAHPALPVPAVHMQEPYSWDRFSGYWTCNVCPERKKVVEGHLSSTQHRHRETQFYGQPLPVHMRR